jgi:hypothetical protein
MSVGTFYNLIYCSISCEGNSAFEFCKYILVAGYSQHVLYNIHAFTSHFPNVKIRYSKLEYFSEYFQLCKILS